MARDAGIVDKHMDIAEPGEGLSDRVGRSDVGLCGLDYDPVLAEHIHKIEHFVAAIDRGDGRALGAEKSAEPLADTARCAGDGDGLSGK